jgi:hypothetical protein
VVEHSRNSVKFDEKLRRLVIVFHHELFELIFGFSLLVVRAEINVQLFSEYIEVCKPCGLVCRIVDEEGLEIIESWFLQEGQNIGDLRSAVTKIFRLGPKIEFELEEEAPTLLRVLTIERVGVPKLSLLCCYVAGLFPPAFSASLSSAASN